MPGAARTSPQVPFRPINVPLPRILRLSPNSRFWRKAVICRKRGGVAQILKMQASILSSVHARNNRAD
jgi:hypothetical protein